MLRRPVPSRAAALAATALLLVLPACSDEPDLEGRSSEGVVEVPPSPGDLDPAPTPTATAAPAVEVSTPAGEGEDGPPFPADTAVDTAEPEGGPLSVTQVRAARQDGYDRVVFELAGDQPGAPGWRVEYVEEARQDGSGDEVEVEGGAVLQVLVTGVGYPFDTGQEEASTDLTPSGTALVREVDLQATYEGQYQAFVGVDREVPFRVFRLEDPARVVVDLRHD